MMKLEVLMSLMSKLQSSGDVKLYGLVEYATSILEAEKPPLLPWRCRQRINPKPWHESSNLQDAIFRKTVVYKGRNTKQFFFPMAKRHYRGFTIIFRHITLGRTPLDERSARRRDLYLTTHNTQKRVTSMPQARFETATLQSELLPTTVIVKFNYS
jgi:hypothetical protein